VLANNPRFPEESPNRLRRVDLQGQKDGGSGYGVLLEGPRITRQHVCSSNWRSIQSYSVSSWYTLCQLLCCALRSHSISIVLSPKVARCRPTRPTYEAPTTIMFLMVAAMASISLEGQEQRSIKHSIKIASLRTAVVEDYT
jgi:hypothetical protein